MACKCLSCGHIFESCERAEWEESRGEYWGTPCYEAVDGCPICGGDYEETKPCRLCGCECTYEETNDGVCFDCIDKYRYDDDMCARIGDSCTAFIELNGFLADMFSRAEIEEILLRELSNTKEALGKIDCSKFIDGDNDGFSDRLVEEVNKRDDEEARKNKAR